MVMIIWCWVMINTLKIKTILSHHLCSRWCLHLHEKSFRVFIDSNNVINELLTSWWVHWHHFDYLPKNAINISLLYFCEIFCHQTKYKPFNIEGISSRIKCLKCLLASRKFFRQSLVVVLQNCVLSHLQFSWTSYLGINFEMRIVSIGSRSNKGRTFIMFYLPSYREHLLFTACIKPWFGLDIV